MSEPTPAPGVARERARRIDSNRFAIGEAAPAGSSRFSLLVGRAKPPARADSIAAVAATPSDPIWTSEPRTMAVVVPATIAALLALLFAAGAAALFLGAIAGVAALLVGAVALTLADASWSAKWSRSPSLAEREPSAPQGSDA